MWYNAKVYCDLGKIKFKKLFNEIDAIPSKIVLARLCAVNLEAHFLKSRRDVFAYPVDIIHLFVFDVKRFYQKTPHPKMSAEKINILFK